MYSPTLDEALRGTMEAETPNTYYAKEMRYPIKGGYREFVRPVAEQVNVQYDKNVVRIIPEQHKVILEDNTEYRYEQLVSSLPLPEVINMLPKVPVIVKSAAEHLLASSICLVSVGFLNVKKFPSEWFYVYDEDIPFARVHSPNLKSVNNAPHGKSSLQFEIYYTKEKPLQFTDEQLKEIVLQQIINMKIATEKDIEFIDVRHVKYANVIFYLGMEDDRKIVLDYLQQQKIKTIGRFGEWDYLWSDQSFLSGINSCILYNSKDKSISCLV